MLKHFFAFAVLYTLLGNDAQAIDLTAKIREAEAAFDARAYRRALDLYQEVVASGHVNGHVYYNMGIAWYRLQRKGEAMAALLAARHYLPRDADVKFNLAHVQDNIADKLGVEMPRRFYDALGFITDFVTARELSFTALLALGVGLLLLTVWLFYRQIVFLLKLGVLLLAIAMLSVVFLQAKAMLAEHWGAVIATRVPVRSGPSEDNTKLFVLHEGAPFIVEQEGNDYLQIKLSDGKKGWIAADTARTLSIVRH